MAAGDPFSIKTNIVLTIEPDYHNIITQSESMKKEFFNLSSTATERYHLKFSLLTNTERDALLTHYNDQYGEYHSFSWQSVPNYINSGNNITGRWLKKSLRMTPVSSKYWKCEIKFEKDV